MCTVVILRRPQHAWPVIIGANRDEMLNRPWKPPARHWPDRADVLAGLDELGGGTWMGLNEAGVVACILNRHGSLGPAPGKRSRGELVLEALDHADAASAAAALADLAPMAYRPFNMVIADNRDAWWLALVDDRGPLRAEKVPEGISMFTAFDRNDTRDPRIQAFLPRFRATAPPDPDAGDWSAWQSLLAATDPSDETRGMCFRTASGFGTSSSSLLALPSPEAVYGPGKKQPVWHFAAGAPDATPFAEVKS